MLSFTNRERRVIASIYKLINQSINQSINQKTNKLDIDQFQDSIGMVWVAFVV